ncbi:chorismate synthase, partial [Tanacetum coccineum]
AAGISYGNYFRVTTFGESHGGGVGCSIDGCPLRIPLSEADLQVDLDRKYYLAHHSSFLPHHPFSHGRASASCIGQQKWIFFLGKAAKVDLRIRLL